MIDLEELAKAIQNSLYDAGHELLYEEAWDMAYRVLNFFGYNERILDNILESEDRDIFYTLEDTGILISEREETSLYDGREWRIHYWFFNKQRLHELANMTLPTQQAQDFFDYNSLPPEIWHRSNDGDV